MGNETGRGSRRGARTRMLRESAYAIAGVVAWLGGALVGVGGIVLAGAQPASSQELSLALGRSTSDYRELGNPTSLAAALVVPVYRAIGVRVDYRRHTDEQAWERSTCDGLIPPDSPGCEIDIFDSDFALQAFSAGPQITVPFAGRVRAFAALMWSRLSVDGDWIGRQTGTDLGLTPEETFNGFTVIGGAAVGITRNLDVTIAASRLRPDFTVCVQDVYYPWCEGLPLKSVEFGVSLRR